MRKDKNMCCRDNTWHNPVTMFTTSFSSRLLLVGSLLAAVTFAGCDGNSSTNNDIQDVRQAATSEYTKFYNGDSGMCQYLTADQQEKVAGSVNQLLKEGGGKPIPANSTCEQSVDAFFTKIVTPSFPGGVNSKTWKKLTAMQLAALKTAKITVKDDTAIITRKNIDKGTTATDYVPVKMVKVDGKWLDATGGEIGPD